MNERAISWNYCELQNPFFFWMNASGITCQLTFLHFMLRIALVFEIQHLLLSNCSSWSQTWSTPFSCILLLDCFLQLLRSLQEQRICRQNHLSANLFFLQSRIPVFQFLPFLRYLFESKAFQTWHFVAFLPFLFPLFLTSSYHTS